MSLKQQPRPDPLRPRKPDLVTPALIAASFVVAPALFAAVGFVGGLYVQRSILRSTIQYWRSPR